MKTENDILNLKHEVEKGYETLNLSEQLELSSIYCG